MRDAYEITKLTVEVLVKLLLLLLFIFTVLTLAGASRVWDLFWGKP